MFEGKNREDGYVLPWLLVDSSVFEFKTAQTHASSDEACSETSDHDEPSNQMIVESDDYHGHHLQHVWERKSSADMKQLQTDSATQGWNIALRDIHVVARLGEGSTSEVFAGQWHNQLTAVKVMKEGTSSQDFLNEIEAVRKLPAHTNVVSFFGVCTDFQVPIAVYEYLGGGTLDDVLIAEESVRAHGPRALALDARARQQQLEQSVAWMRDLFAALACLHSCAPKLLHRDVKPANLLLSADRSRLKLADFGLCREEARPDDARCMTGVSGSLRYMAPEVYLGAATYGSAVDIWSASMVTWAAIARQRPFGALADCHAVELVAKHGLRPPVLPATDNVHHTRLAHVIERGLSADARSRPCAAEMLRELAKVQESLGGGAGTARLSPAKAAGKLRGVGGKLQKFRHGVLNRLVAASRPQPGGKALDKGG